MENLTLDNYQEKAVKSLFTKAKKMIARDFEEISPNKFVAYVDEESDSYDVTIEIEGRNVVNISCDCPKNSSFCVHKISMLHFIFTKKPANKIAVKKKQSEFEILLEQLDEPSLRYWVSELLKKNKDIEFLFVNEFNQTEIQYTKDEVAAIIDKSIKSVIKNKKKFDATELKKIIDALEMALAPVSKFCMDTITLPESNDLFLYSNSVLFEFNEIMTLNSIKLIRFIEKRYKEINLFIHSVQNKSQWETIIDENIKYFLLDDGMYGMQMETVFHLYDSIDTKERKAFFANIIFDIHTIKFNNGIQFIKEIRLFFIKVFSENDLFSKIYSHFEPIRYENEFNIFLVEKLIEIEQFDRAETISLKQIENNYQERYNLGYYHLLLKIYTISDDEKKMAQLQMRLIFIDFSLENYKLIEKHFEVDTFKKFRTKLLTALKRNFYDSNISVNSYFQILFYEKKFKNMIDNISEHTSYELIYTFKEELFLFDKVAFLISITNIERNSYYYYKDDKATNEYRQKCIDWILLKYDDLMIKNIIKSRKSHGISKFIKTLEENFT